VAGGLTPAPPRAIPGVLGVGILFSLRPALRRTYDHAETRRMEAHDLG
jgi:hypothetical protein